MTGVFAVVPVRGGVLPYGGAEAVAEATGRVLLVGDGTADAAAELGAVAREVSTWECGDYRPGSWSAALVPVLTGERVVVLPASPDGRDLAPRLAHALGRHLFAPAMEVSADSVTVIRDGGLRTEQHRITAPCIATLQPGVRGVDPADGDPPVPQALDLGGVATVLDATTTGVLEADPATVGLADARRIIGVGVGVGSRERSDLAHAVATALGASFGATRVVTDLGWAPVSRQIGTTGVVVHPDLYVSFGVSGAVQHITGIKDPGTVVSVNLDASCPMMAIADLAIVTDARALLDELARRLGIAAPELEEVSRG